MTSSDQTGTPAPVVLGGRYEIYRRLARGGMAEVFLARDQALDRPVAVKILFPEFATDPAFVERFRREAQAAANLAHPNIVGVYDWGSESGTYYIVMEYVEGQSLAEVVRTAGPLHPRRAAEVVFEVAGALGFAHHRGVVHRDVKPGNVIISTAGTAKVTDFGIARALSSNAEDLTQAGSVMGTATYFSPEQAQGLAVDARSDLYSLGVVLYEVLCGRPPFVGDSPVAIAYKHVQEWPPRPSQFVTGVPTSLESVILKLLAKKPEQRYLSADDLRADLRRFLDGEPTVAEQELASGSGANAAGAAIDATRAVPATGPAVGNDATTVMPVQPPPVAPAPPVAAPASLPDGGGQPPPFVAPDPVDEEPAARNGLFIGLAVVLLALLGGLGYWLYTSLNDDDTPTEDLIAVPSVIQFDRADAENRLRADGFNPKVQEEASNEANDGVVFKQSPEPNTQLAKGSDVTIFVSTGPELVELPNVAGLPEVEASSTLTAAGFTVKSTIVESDTVEAGNVIETTPPAGTQVRPKSEIILRVSSGQGMETLPIVSGKTVDEAKKALTDLGFVVGEIVEQPSATVDEGLVLSTDPVATAPKKSTVKLLVSSGPAQVKVPAVKGQPEAAATAALREKGLEVESVAKALPAGDANDGRVVDVSPAAGQTVDVGSMVKITVGVASASTTTVAPSTTAGATSTTAP